MPYRCRLPCGPSSPSAIEWMSSGIRTTAVPATMSSSPLTSRRAWSGSEPSSRRRYSLLRSRPYMPAMTAQVR
ncbi:Uncharacterised protein [Bordetella pertussis]|nr:Uncharacterised protein [Bordetella pertussis]